MKKEKISQIIGGIDDEYIGEAALFGMKEANEKRESLTERKTPLRRFIRYAAICAALILAAGTAAFAIAAEANEYNTALSFFEENGLSAEGLSRSEIKAVYRDITTNSFSDSKTAEVIKKAVPGWEISQSEPTPEELAAIWDKNVWRKELSLTGVDYKLDTKYVYDEKLGFEVLDRTEVGCYKDGKSIWTAELKDMFAEKCVYTDEGTVITGWIVTRDPYQNMYGKAVLLDGDGKLIWEHVPAHGFRKEYIASVLNNGDGSWAVISRGDLKYLCLCTLDKKGVETGFRRTEVGNLGIRNAARLGDGYIVQLGNDMTRDTALLYKMDRDGNVTDSFSYHSDDLEYHITDMTEFGGRVYLSAYAVPIQTDGGGRHEIADILKYLFTENYWSDITSEELTPLVRANYTAVLLLCDADKGAPQNFYSVNGSLGGKLSVKDGLLEWDVESIVSTFFSPATSAFTIGGRCKVYHYTFDGSGTLTAQTDTGAIVPYAR